MLKTIFYEKKGFLLETLDTFLALVDSTLQTHFGTSLRDSCEDEQTFIINEAPPPNSTTLDQVRFFLNNMREMVGILTNILIN